jgi:hypothetical protein
MMYWYKVYGYWYKLKVKGHLEISFRLRLFVLLLLGSKSESPNKHLDIEKRWTEALGENEL